eukprot:TRINITY_DN50620_c0_g1_i1.p1 TRINITY_DN50620_c0_g1~~TRINITY_DN50620_c0_g1_i1.p1  ORF type:complete len:224 (+),score=42.16 TRINITY_DN50620_c0_g1_i1:115-786(+)
MSYASRDLGATAGRSEEGSLSIRVLIVGAAGAGKSSIVRAVLRDPAIEGSEAEEEADGLRMRKVFYAHRALRAAVELVEFPSDDRYAPLMPMFATGSACIVFAISLADPTGPRDLEVRVAALGGPPRCGILVAGGGPDGGASGRTPEDAYRRLQRLRELAAQWSLHLVCAENLEQLEVQCVLRTACGLVFRDVPERPDPVQLLGTCAAMSFGGDSRLPLAGSG